MWAEFRPGCVIGLVWTSAARGPDLFISLGSMFDLACAVPGGDPEEGVRAVPLMSLDPGGPACESACDSPSDVTGAAGRGFVVAAGAASNRLCSNTPESGGAMGTFCVLCESWEDTVGGDTDPGRIVVKFWVLDPGSIGGLAGA